MKGRGGGLKGVKPPNIIYLVYSLRSSLSLENILLKAANGEVYEEDFQMAIKFLADINFDHLQKEFLLCTDLF